MLVCYMETRSRIASEKAFDLPAILSPPAPGAPERATSSSTSATAESRVPEYPAFLALFSQLKYHPPVVYLFIPISVHWGNIPYVGQYYLV